MRPNGDPTAMIAVKVYPGIFDGELQVSVDTERGEIHLNVSTAFVKVDGTPSEEGTDGRLRVDIVKENGESFIVALPGEVQGAPSRVNLSKRLLYAV